MDILTLLIDLIIFVCIISIAWWIINVIAPPEPIRKVCLVIFGLIAIVALLSFAGGGFGSIRLR